MWLLAFGAQDFVYDVYNLLGGVVGFDNIPVHIQKTKLHGSFVFTDIGQDDYTWPAAPFGGTHLLQHFVSIHVGHTHIEEDEFWLERFTNF